MATQTKTLIVGITGGIATGKSTLLAMFRAGGIPTIDSDRIAHDELRRGTRVFSDVVAKFGEDYLDASGQIDRRKLGEMVFRRPALRRVLERIVHPAVFAEIARRIRTHRRRRRRIIAVDIPLLFETRASRVVDIVVVAYAPRAAQVRRLKLRGFSPAAARARIDAQWSIEYKRRRADRVFKMTRPVKQVRREVKTWIHSLCS